MCTTKLAIAPLQTLAASKLILKVAAHNFLTPPVPQLINAPLEININKCCCTLTTRLVISPSCFLHCHQIRNSAAPLNLKKPKENC